MYKMNLKVLVCGPRGQINTRNFFCPAVNFRFGFGLQATRFNFLHTQLELPQNSCHVFRGLKNVVCIDKSQNISI